MQIRLFKSLPIAGLIIAALNCLVSGQSNTLIPFSLKDQFDHTYTDKEYRDYYVILVGGDRKGSDYCFLWSDALKMELVKDSMKAEIKVLGIADLQAAPSTFHGFIKGKFPKERKKWVLLDWEGIFARAYQFQEDAGNIIIFDPEGYIIYSTSVTEVEENQLNKLISTIHKHSSKRI